MRTLLFLIAGCLAYNHNDRYSKDYPRDYAIDDYPPRQVQGPITHTFPNRSQCNELCEMPCSITNVYMGAGNIEMFNCARLRPPKVSMLGSIKSSSFYMTLIILGGITAAVIALLTICFCCSYCCRSPVSSRGSSKDALTQEDGEFREYLHDDVGTIRKEREFSRRPRTAQIV